MEIHNPLTSNQCHVKSLMVSKPWQTLIYIIHTTMFYFIMQVTHQLKEHTVYVVLPRSPWNWNAARKPLTSI